MLPCSMKWPIILRLEGSGHKLSARLWAFGGWLKCIDEYELFIETKVRVNQKLPLFFGEHFLRQRRSEFCRSRHQEHGPWLFDVS